MNEKNKHVCPVENAKGLDNIFRKLVQNPKKILKDYVKEGMTVLDVGCGPGFFLIIEPPFHVSKKAFEETVNRACAIGFKEIKRPGMILNKAVVLGK